MKFFVRLFLHNRRKRAVKQRSFKKTKRNLAITSENRKIYYTNQFYNNILKINDNFLNNAIF